MGFVDELERLVALHRDGSLTDDEFVTAKAAVLSSRPLVAAPPAKSIEQQTNQWAMILHVSQVVGMGMPFGSFIAPVIIWAIKRDEFPGLRPHWVVVMNWLISSAIYCVLGCILMFALSGLPFFFISFPFTMVLFLVAVVFPVVGGLKASQGVVWKYPLSFPFLKA